jgi:hypothetical protein
MCGVTYIADTCGELYSNLLGDVVARRVTTRNTEHIKLT